MDHTREITRRGCNFDYHLLRLPLDRTVPTSSLGTEALPPFLRGYRNDQHVNSYSRGRFRIAFEEVGLPLYKGATYDTVFSTLRDALAGLGAMHESGLMHGDVSSDNILRVCRPGQKEIGVILDLEYGSQAAGHHTRTVSAYLFGSNFLWADWHAE
ncbi:hypothetical protein FA95DRAFT_1613335 [Auriscalpium vulgare]|uniref:Uncharacterized protein n=1 Tax=Auriscalpium vulgare TaxID=40419 RepID=A0ACB8R372_9AGAM|nr:hypothetical protein FA95DRAFT_1613335 [Auriscalpium vulgare]